MTRWLLAGYGDTAQRVARLAKKQGIHITATSRTDKSDQWVDDYLCWDLDEHYAQTLSGFDTIFYFTPPPGEGETDPRVAFFLHQIDPTLPLRKLIYISTTAVYGDNSGEWVDEHTVSEPGTARGKRRLAAENQFHKAARRFGCQLAILRVSGIYSASRLPFERIRKQVPILRAEDSGPSNRIHADDLAMICMAAASRPTPSITYNVSDGHPTTMCDYFCSVARLFQLPEPPQVDWSTAQATFSPALMSYLAETRKISNQRLLAELNLRLQYPTLQEGLLQCFTELNGKAENPRKFSPA